jgi:hypothetical protein
MTKKYKTPSPSTPMASEPTAVYTTSGAHSPLTKKYSQEDLWHAIEQDPELLLKPSEIIDDDDEVIDLETAREMTHQAVHNVYAMPDRDMTPEELYDAIEKEIDYIYAQD